MGCIGFGGPPTHIALLRRLCVDERGWMSADEFEHAVAAVNLLPGPASTQLNIYAAWRLRRTAGAIVGGLCFIVPGLVVILGLSGLFLASHPPRVIAGAALGAGAAIPAVALFAASGLVSAGWRRVGDATAARARWIVYALAGGACAVVAGPWLALVMVACGLSEVVVRSVDGTGAGAALMLTGTARLAVAVGGLGAVAWVAFKVGALSYGGGFVIIPLMQHDAVHTYHWMSSSQFLTAVALGQITPGPVVLTVAVVGYAAAGIGGGLLAVACAFAPSFFFVIGGGRHFDGLRSNVRVQHFLTGAGAAVIGAIAGSAIPLGRALAHPWQVAVLGGAALWLLALRRNLVACLLLAAIAGAVVALAGGAI